MPQIAQLASTYSSQIFWILVFFGLVFFVVGRGMVPKVVATVELRDARIASDLAAAEQARNEAEAAQDAWEVQEKARRAEAHGVVTQAKLAGSKKMEERLAEAGKGVEARIAAAEARIAEARQAALGEIEGVAAEAARDIVARVAGLSVDEGAARAAVQGALAHG